MSKNLKVTDYNCWYGTGCNPHTQGLCPHQHPAEAEKKVEMKLNNNKEVTHDNINNIPNYNSISKTTND